MNNKNILVWFRNDLRIHDCETLYRASQQAQQTGANIFPIYCFDPRHFGKTSFGFSKTGVFRAQFLIESVANLRANLRSLNSDLTIRMGKPEDVLPKFIQQWGIRTVYYYAEITSEETNVEAKLTKLLQTQKIEIKSFWGSTLLHPQDLPFAITKLPELFTNFRKQVELDLIVRKIFPIPNNLDPLPDNLKVGDIPNLAHLG
ncbi:MAG: deoxyribodipyrimidine photo-lyase, partial [Pseudanabaena sp.]